MKRRIRLTESQLNRVLKLNEDIVNDPITKQYTLLDKKMSKIWSELSSLTVTEFFERSNELVSTKDQLEVISNKLSELSSTSEMVLNKIEAEFGSDKMYAYDDHYTKLSSEVGNKNQTLIDFVDELVKLAKYSKLGKLFPNINI